MLTLEKFINAWDELIDRYGEKVGSVTMQTYYEYLKNKLDDNDLGKAVKLCVLKEKWFPTADEIIDRVKVSLDEQIESYWKTIIEAAKRGQRPELPPLANEALSRIGGRLAIEQCSESKLPWLKKEFGNLFKLLANNNQKQLPESNENAA